MSIEFKLVRKEDDNGQLQDTLVKCTKQSDGTTDEEGWCTVNELDRLFEACARRWTAGWDLEKLITCVNECDFD